MTTQREAFEAWAIEEGHFVGKDGAGDYKRLPAYWMWTAWQAAQAAMQAELMQLRGFAADMMGSWPDGYLDGSDLQDSAAAHSLLTMELAHQPCGDSCACAEYTSCAQFEAGVECYRKSKVLLDAQIARTGSAA